MQHRRLLHALAFSWSLAGAAACGPDREHYDPPPPCTDGARCAGPAAGGVGSGSGGGGGQGGGVSATNVEGTVVVLSTTDFQQTTPLLAGATVTAPASTGTAVGSYDPATASFVLEGAKTGDAWVLVEPDLGSGALATYSFASVQVGAPLTLPVASEEVMIAIAGSLPVPESLEAGKAQLVLQIARDGLPLAGASVVSSVAGATVVYDEGPGTYSTQPVATGSGGTVVLFNFSAGVSSNDVTVSLTDEALNQRDYQVKVLSDTVTVAGLDFTL